MRCGEKCGLKRTAKRSKGLKHQSEQVAATEQYAIATEMRSLANEIMFCLVAVLPKADQTPGR